MFEVTLTIQDLDAATHQEAAEMFRDAILNGVELVCQVTNDENRMRFVTLDGIEKR